MLNAFIQLPEIVRYGLVGLVALLAGPLINWGIYRLAYFSKPISPWIPLASRQSSRNWIDCIPIYGWIRLRRESKEYGDWFWVRPLLIEAGFPTLIVWLYHFEINGGLLPQNLAVQKLVPNYQPELHQQFFIHALLCSFMAAATFIDFDEQTIPDSITVPGTSLGLIIAFLAPGSRFLYLRSNPVPPSTLEPMNAAAPADWPAWLSGPGGLTIALFAYFLWCFGIANRVWITRRGLRKAITYFFASLVRHQSWVVPAILLIIGQVLILLAYFVTGGQGVRWESLLSSLIGMALAGITVWAVRIVAGGSLGQEGLGFGDVTLMAMVGTVLGWQPSVLVFFFAPILAIVFVLVRFIITNNKQTPFGPYLCFAALVVMVGWDRVWNQWAVELFRLGLVLLLIFGCCLVLLGGMLLTWRVIRDRLFPE